MHQISAKLTKTHSLLGHGGNFIGKSNLANWMVLLLWCRCTCQVCVAQENEEELLLFLIGNFSNLAQPR